MRETLVKSGDFKDSPLGRIPKDWDVVTLASLFHIQTGATPLRTKHQSYFADGTVPWVKTMDLNEGCLVNTDERITEVALKECSLQLLPPKTVLIAMYGGWEQIGRTGILKYSATTNQAISSLVKTSPLVEPEFVLRALQYGRIRWKGIAASTRKDPNITRDDVANFLIPLPPLSEQRRIAEIIDTVDEAIARTESLIMKLRQMKAGLLHDLLTRGLDENGQLRDAIAHPEQFKDSPLGRIPNGWEVFKLSEIVPHAEYGVSVSLDDEVGIPVLRMNNLKDGEVDLTDLKKSASSQAANLLLQPLDVLFNRTNSIEHVGRTAIWRGQIERASFASYLVRLIPEKSKLIPEYLNIWLNLPTTQLLIRRYATPGVHQVNINPTNLRKVLIALPQKISEQEAIVEKVAAHNTRIRTEEAYRDKLKLQKKGLMYDLLTGKVRVNGTEPAEEDTSWLTALTTA